MQEEKEPPSRPRFKKYLIIFIFSSLLSLLSLIQYSSPPEFHVGDVAKRNIRAPKDIYGESHQLLLKKGEMVVREGERIKEEHMEKIIAMEKLFKKEHPLPRKIFTLFFLFFFITSFIYEFAERNIKKFSLTEKDIIFATSFTIFTFLFFIVLSSIFESLMPEQLEFQYVIPVLMYGMILRIVLFSEASIIFITLFSIFSSLIFERIDLFVYLLCGNIFASFFSGKCEKRSSLLRAGIFSSLFTSLIVVLLSLLYMESLSSLPKKIFFVFINGMLSSFIALGLLPIIEYFFDYVTDIKLIELSDLEHPLLEELMLKAPGTYHHSIIVGNLAKAAAENIGAHPLLSRVSAYFHDVGKIKKAQYFVENRRNDVDLHSTLSPYMSALVILSHIKEGVELARYYRLGKKITDIIAQHHGTGLLRYFYDKAKEAEASEIHVVEEKDFRYPGPKPQTKEAGIVMLADQVEASSRTLEDPTPKRIESHVRTTIENVFLDGQLDESELTLKDLHAIEKSFVNILIGIFHQRVEYQKRLNHGSYNKKRPRDKEDQKKENRQDFRRFARLFRSQR